MGIKPDETTQRFKQQSTEERYQKVDKMMAQGCDTRQIAARLGRSDSVIRGYAKKLGWRHIGDGVWVK